MLRPGFVRLTLALALAGPWFGPPNAAPIRHASDRFRSENEGALPSNATEHRLVFETGRLGCAFVDSAAATPRALSLCVARAIPSSRPVSASAGLLRESGRMNENTVDAALRNVAAAVYQNIGRFIALFLRRAIVDFVLNFVGKLPTPKLRGAPPMFPKKAGFKASRQKLSPRRQVRRHLEKLYFGRPSALSSWWIAFWSGENAAELF